MSEEKKLENMELDDKAVEAVAGGRIRKAVGVDFWCNSGTCNELIHAKGDVTCKCGANYKVNLRGWAVDGPNGGVNIKEWYTRG